MTVEGTIPRAVGILRVLIESEGDMSVQDIAGRVALPSSTVHRLLQMLRGEGMVEHDPASRRYRPGPTLLRLSAQLGVRRSIDDAAVPHLRSIVDACNENAQFGVLLAADRQMMFTRQVQSSHALRFNAELYEPISLLWGCSGRVICAHLPDDVVRAVHRDAGSSATSGAEPPALKEFQKSLARIRQQQWDGTRGEKLAESVGFAAPIIAAKGVVGSLSITVPEHRFDDTRTREYVRLVTDAATEFSAELGGSTRPASG